MHGPLRSVGNIAKYIK